MNIKNKLKLTIIPVSLFLVFIVFFYDGVVLNVASSNMCKAHKKAVKISLDGLLTKKYRDSNDHMVKKLEIRLADGEIVRTSFLASEVSGFFDKIELGDSIIKNEGSLDVLLFRDEKKYVYTLDYMCIEATNKNI